MFVNNYYKRSTENFLGFIFCWPHTVPSSVIAQANHEKGAGNIFTVGAT